MNKIQDKLKVTDKDQGLRLDLFLNENLSQYSRAQIQKLIITEQIIINKQFKAKNYRIKSGDTVEIILNKIKSIKTVPKIKIIKTSKNYIIVDKPAGLVVHPDTNHKLNESLIGQIIKKYPSIKKIGDNPDRPGVVHRLDKNVSGVMVVARSQAMFEHLKNQFKNKKVTKEYVALVFGLIKQDEAKLNFSMSRKKTGFMAARPKNSPGKESQTNIDIIKRYNKYSLIKATPLTGRMHQIKAHLAAFGYPIVGEAIYTNKKAKKDKLNDLLDRPFLHAIKIGFFDLENKWQKFTSDIPKQLKDLIKQLSN